MRSSIFFHVKFLPVLKILFVEPELLKVLKNQLEEDFPNVAPSNILFGYCDFIFLLYLPILNVLYI